MAEEDFLSLEQPSLSLPTTFDAGELESRFIERISEELKTILKSQDVQTTSIKQILKSTIGDLPVSSLKTLLLANIDTHTETLIEIVLASGRSKKRKSTETSPSDRKRSKKGGVLDQVTYYDESTISSILDDISEPSTKVHPKDVFAQYKKVLMSPSGKRYSNMLGYMKWKVYNKKQQGGDNQTDQHIDSFFHVVASLQDFSFAISNPIDLIETMKLFSQYFEQLVQAINDKSISVSDEQIQEILEVSSKFLALQNYRKNFSMCREENSFSKSSTEMWSTYRGVLVEGLRQYVCLFSLLSTQFTMKKYFHTKCLSKIVMLCENDLMTLFTFVISLHIKETKPGTEEDGLEGTAEEQQVDDFDNPSFKILSHLLFYYLLIKEERILAEDVLGLLSSFTKNYFYFFLAANRVMEAIEQNTYIIANEKFNNNISSEVSFFVSPEELGTIENDILRITRKIKVPLHLRQWMQSQDTDEQIANMFLLDFDDTAITEMISVYSKGEFISMDDIEEDSYSDEEENPLDIVEDHQGLDNKYIIDVNSSKKKVTSNKSGMMELKKYMEELLEEWDEDSDS